jgi:hypothetical protein
MNWNLKINAKLKGQQWNIDMTASEESLLTMMRGMYWQFEAILKALAQENSTATLPSGLLDDVLSLLRCLIFNRFEAYRGEHVQIARVGK